MIGAVILRSEPAPVGAARLHRLVVALGERVHLTSCTSLALERPQEPRPIHSSPPSYTSFFQRGTSVLSDVDRVLAGRESVGAVRGADRDHDRRLAELDPPDAMVDRDRVELVALLELGGELAPSSPRPSLRTPRSRGRRPRGRASGARAVPEKVAIAPASSVATSATTALERDAAPR